MEWLWPSECAGCGRLGEGTICDSCQPGPPRRLGLRRVGLSGGWTLAPYTAPLGDLVHRCKRTHDRRLGVQIARAFAGRAAPALARDWFTLVVPVPSPWTRRLWRGFSLAALLAGELSRRAQLPIDDFALRAVPGRKQATRTQRERARAQRGRFRSTRALSGRILLIDDVVTTGSTASACASELLGAGAGEVWLLSATAAVRRHGETGVQIL